MGCSPFTRCRYFLGAQSNVIGVLQEILSHRQADNCYGDPVHALQTLLWTAAGRPYRIRPHGSTLRCTWEWNVVMAYTSENFGLQTTEYKDRKYPPPHRRRRQTGMCRSGKQGST